MKIDRRITNGLAWAGAALVVGVPTADLVSAQFAGAPSPAAAPQVAVVAPVAPVPAPLSQRPQPAPKPAQQVAAATPKAVPEAKPAAAKPAGDVVNTFLQSGRELPSYINDGPAKPASPQVAATPSARTPIVTTPEPAPETDPIEVAAIPPQKIAPVPMPLSMRPKPVSVAAQPQQVVVIPPEVTASAPPAAVVRPPIDITAADLEDWESGPLSEFLARHQQAGHAYAAPSAQPQGFWLDEGPNRPQGDRVIGRGDPFIYFAD